MSNTAEFGITVDRDIITDQLTTDEDESDELFSDDEQKKQTKYKSDTLSDASILCRSETPLSLIDNSSAITPSNAAVPSTPLSLVPFLNKINDPWTSDLETPQADKSAQTYTRPLTSATRSAEETPNLEQCTPEISVKNIDNKISSNSPVIVSRRIAKRPKRRRIFRTSISTDTSTMISNEHITTNIHVEVALTSDNTDSMAQDKANDASIPPIVDTCKIYESQILNTVQDIFNDKELDKYRDTAVDISNSSPHDLFTMGEVLPKTKLQFMQQSEAYDKIKDYVTNHEKPSVSNKFGEKISVPTTSFLSSDGACTNALKNSCTKAFLLTDELHKENNDDALRKNEKLSPGRKCITARNMMPLSSLITPNNISEKAREKEFVKQLNVPIEIASRIDTNVDNQLDIKISTIGFQTACSVPINISERTLSKAKILLTDELNKSIHSNLSNQADICNKEIKQQEVEFSSIKFQTGRGAPINISEKALVKAQRLLGEELDTSLELRIAKEDNEESRSKGIEMSNVGFRTDCDANINISEKALSKARILFGNELYKSLELGVMEEDNIYNKKDKIKEIQLPNVEFQTDHGAPINISEKALIEAKIILVEELDKPLEPSITKEDNIYNDASKRKEIGMSHGRFRTSRGATINISEAALSKAKIFFGKELDEPLELGVAEEDNIYNEEDQREEIQVPNTGFQTGRSQSINISEEALIEAQKLLGDGLDTPLELGIAKKDNVYNKESKRKGIEMSNVGFRTGRGATINISEAALSTAKIFFCKELDKPLELDGAEEVNIYNEEGKVKEVQVPNVGFQTGRGAPINVSREALSKAEISFGKELDKPLEPDVAKEDGYNEEGKRKEIEISNVEFYTGHGAPINISEKALFKAKTLLREELGKPLEPHIAEEDNAYNEEDRRKGIEMSNVGVRTSRGANISISEKALSKARIFFGKDLDNPLELSVMEEDNIYNKKDKIKEIQVPNVGFQTGCDARTNISKEALSEAKSLLATELDKPLELTDAHGINAQNAEVLKQEMKTPNTEFRISHGASINISQQLCKAKILDLAEHLDYSLETDISENIRSDNRKTKGHDIEISHCGFRTAGDQQGTISNNAVLELTASYNGRLNMSNSDVAVISCALLQKRKLITDETTPLGRVPALVFKKARLNDECEDTKLSFNNSGADTINYEKIESKDITNKILIDENTDGNRTTEASCIVVLPSTAEFDTNKEKQIDVTSSTLASPKRDTSTESMESDIIGSPVLGRQLASKKRKSLERRKDRHRAQQPDKMILDNTYVTREDIAQENTSCEKTEDKLTAELQEPVSTSIQAKRLNVENNLLNTESNEYGDTQVMMDFIDESAQILQDRLAAAFVQENVITAKRRHQSEQIIGCLYRYKHINSNARSSLREISNGVPPLPRSHQELIDRRIPPNILAITAMTAASYKFRCSDFYGSNVARTNVDGIEMEDGARLIMDENGYVGVWEFLRAFLASPGVDPNLVPARWIENHYRWIVWKLASIDRMKFGSAELPRMLTPSHVMTQLKYRYDREIDRSQRSAVRRILEKDDAASKRMILCVSSIVENNNLATEVGKSPRIGIVKWKIELTDGWYSIPACIDIGMMKNISTGKVKEGTKLVIYGAELLNCDEGCYPLEASPDVCLKLHTNSTRRARWDSKLGYMSHSGPIIIRLRDVCPSGGLIGKITVVVARVYPMLYHERTASGESIVRNSKCEEKMQIEYERQYRSKMEAFYAKAEKDFQDLSCEMDSMDMAARSSRNHKELYTQEEEYKQELQSKLRESLPVQRRISPLLKIRVCDEDTNAILSIWSPSEEIIDGIKEGACVSFRNVLASGRRGCELQLTAYRSAILNPGIMQDTSYPSRMCTLLWEISNSEFSSPYGEFDTVGFVCSVGPAPYGMKDFEVVHLTYPNADSSNSSYISILFWQGIASFGYAGILTVGSIVACNNLEWRRATSWNVPVAYCTDRSTFTCNPRRNHLYEPFQSLRNLITDPATYIEKCSSGLSVELQKKPTTRTPTRYTPGKNTPDKIYNSVSNSDKKLVHYASPLSAPRSGPATSRGFIAANSSIQKRLDKLQYYGEPPELSPITIRSSKRVSLNFRSPVLDRTNASSTHKPGHSHLSIAPEKQ